MGKSKVIGVSVSIEPGSNGRVQATFYRYEKGRHPAYDDWMQSHANLTQASCRRLRRIVDGGSVNVWPDGFSIFQKIDGAFWGFEKQEQRNADYWKSRAADLENEIAIERDEAEANVATVMEIAGLVGLSDSTPDLLRLTVKRVRKLLAQYEAVKRSGGEGE